MPGPKKNDISSSLSLRAEFCSSRTNSYFLWFKECALFELGLNLLLYEFLLRISGGLSTACLKPGAKDPLTVYKSEAWLSESASFTLNRACGRRTSLFRSKLSASEFPSSKILVLYTLLWRSTSNCLSLFDSVSSEASTVLLECARECYEIKVGSLSLSVVMSDSPYFEEPVPDLSFLESTALATVRICISCASQLPNAADSWSDESSCRTNVLLFLVDSRKDYSSSLIVINLFF